LLNFAFLREKKTLISRKGGRKVKGIRGEDSISTTGKFFREKVHVFERERRGKKKKFKKLQREKKKKREVHLKGCSRERPGVREKERKRRGHWNPLPKGVKGIPLFLRGPGKKKQVKGREPRPPTTTWEKGRDSRGRGGGGLGQQEIEKGEKQHPKDPESRD